MGKSTINGHFQWLCQLLPEGIPLGETHPQRFSGLPLGKPKETHLPEYAAKGTEKKTATSRILVPGSSVPCQRMVPPGPWCERCHFWALGYSLLGYSLTNVNIILKHSKTIVISTMNTIVISTINHDDMGVIGTNRANELGTTLYKMIQLMTWI